MGSNSFIQFSESRYTFLKALYIEVHLSLFALACFGHYYDRTYKVK